MAERTVLVVEAGIQAEADRRVCPRCVEQLVQFYGVHVVRYFYPVEAEVHIERVQQNGGGKFAVVFLSDRPHRMEDEARHIAQKYDNVMGFVFAPCTNCLSSQRQLTFRTRNESNDPFFIRIDRMLNQF
jgi:hypothetical protein